MKGIRKIALYFVLLYLNLLSWPAYTETDSQKALNVEQNTSVERSTNQSSQVLSFLEQSSKNRKARRSLEFYLKQLDVALHSASSQETQLEQIQTINTLLEGALIHAKAITEDGWITNREKAEQARLHDNISTKRRSKRQTTRAKAK